MSARAIVLTLAVGLYADLSFAATSPANDPQPAKDTSSSPRPLSAIQADVRAALRSEARTRRQGRNSGEVIRLINLYSEMAAHPKRDKSIMLAKLGLRVRSRLEIVRDQIERQYTPADRDAQKSHDFSETRVLAQQVAVQAGGAFGQAAQPGAAQFGVESIVDYGPELVDLIQQTISPATWNINGGNGAVVYFTPRRALVISAPENVHEQIDDVLGQLRAAP